MRPLYSVLWGVDLESSLYTTKISNVGMFFPNIQLSSWHLYLRYVNHGMSPTASSLVAAVSNVYTFLTVYHNQTSI